MNPGELYWQYIGELVLKRREKVSFFKVFKECRGHSCRIG